MNLQQRIERDLDFLEKAFPHLKEQFPDFDWVASESCVADYFLGFENAIFVELESIHVRRKNDGTEVYSVNLPHDDFLDFPSICAAAEFIGRKARAFTFVNVTTKEV